MILVNNLAMEIYYFARKAKKEYFLKTIIFFNSFKSDLIFEEVQIFFNSNNYLDIARK